jgi:hypothetical protein
LRALAPVALLVALGGCSLRAGSPRQTERIVARDFAGRPLAAVEPLIGPPEEEPSDLSWLLYGALGLVVAGMATGIIILEKR